MALIPGTYIIVFKKDVGSAGDLAFELRERGATVRRVYTHVLVAVSAVLPSDLADELRADPRVQSLEEDQHLGHGLLALPPLLDDALPAVTYHGSAEPPSQDWIGTPPAGAWDVGWTDPDLNTPVGYAWHLDLLGKTERIPDETFKRRYTGAGVLLYVLDSGVKSHVDFANGVETRWVHSSNEWGDGRAVDWFAGEHGTKVAGIIASADAGVAPDVDAIQIVQYYADLFAVPTTSDWLDMLDEVSDHFAASGKTNAVMNVSMFFNYVSSISAAFEQLWDDGIVIVVAGGNLGETAPGIRTPQDLQSTGRGIIVGAVGGLSHGADIARGGGHPPSLSWLGAYYAGPLDGVETYSARGAWVDIYAWSNCLTADPGFNGVEDGSSNYVEPQPPCSPSGYDRAWYGTSFSAPVVAGVCCLLCEEFPDHTPAQIKAVLLDRAAPRIPNLLPGENNRVVTSCQNLWDDDTTDVQVVSAAVAHTDSTVVKGNHYRWRVRRVTGDLINGDWSETDRW